MQQFKFGGGMLLLVPGLKCAQHPWREEKEACRRGIDAKDGISVHEGAP